MSDATPTPPTPEQPTPPPAAAPAYTPAAPVKQGLSITGFVLGIGAIVFLWVPVFGFLVGVAGLIISLIARSREPQAPNWMKILGLVLSIVGLVLSLIYFIFWIVVIVAAATSSTTY